MTKRVRASEPEPEWNRNVRPKNDDNQKEEKKIIFTIHVTMDVLDINEISTTMPPFDLHFHEGEPLKQGVLGYKLIQHQTILPRNNVLISIGKKNPIVMRHCLDDISCWDIRSGDHVHFECEPCYTGDTEHKHRRLNTHDGFQLSTLDPVLGEHVLSWDDYGHFIECDCTELQQPPRAPWPQMTPNGIFVLNVGTMNVWDVDAGSITTWRVHDNGDKTQTSIHLDFLKDNGTGPMTISCDNQYKRWFFGDYELILNDFRAPKRWQQERTDDDENVWDEDRTHSLTIPFRVVPCSEQTMFEHVRSLRYLIPDLWRLVVGWLYL